MTTTAEVKAIINTWPEGAFRWGTSDCCQFAAFVVFQLTQRDTLQAFDYSSEQQAAEYINAAGGLTGLLTATLGTDPVAVDDLDPGDPVLFRQDGYPEAVCVNLGNRRAAGLTKAGRVIEIPIFWCAHGWRVVNCQP